MMLQRLRETVRRIPRGKVATYGDIAKAAGFPGAARQVVWALRHAGAALPWHRVVGAGGRIRLPGEPGLEQRTRLASEGVKFQGDRISMKQFACKFRPRTRRRRPQV
jgi:methylated-DNA-protein-cysteine methyltransferase related protein